VTSSLGHRREPRPFESAPSFLQVALGDGEGNLVTVGSAALPSVPASGSKVATLAWETSGLSGAFTLSAEVDPFGLLDEKDESNNALSRSVSVVSQRGVGLSVSTALSSYAPREDVEIRVEAVNGGASSPIPIETVVEDGIGTRLETLDRRSLVLPFGQSAAYTVFWNTGQSLAGTYRVRVLASVRALRMSSRYGACSTWRRASSRIGPRMSRATRQRFSPA
jgi:hypothetical protein